MPVTPLACSSFCEDAIKQRTFVFNSKWCSSRPSDYLTAQGRPSDLLDGCRVPVVGEVLDLEHRVEVSFAFAEDLCPKSGIRIRPLDRERSDFAMDSDRS